MISHKVGSIKRLLADPNFNPNKPTVLYTHGYLELAADESVKTIVEAYRRRGGYNILVFDWSNLAFGNYVLVALDLPFVGKQAGKTILSLLKGGVALQTLHLVGHSIGCHVLSNAARYLASKGYLIPRLTALDPAYQGFYPPLLGVGLSARDAGFVDVLHTDGGGYGAPQSLGSVDFWPNEGQAKQPGCLSATIPFSNEDFCSHQRSWEFWSEAVTGGNFLARQCVNYDSFLRGQCDDRQLVAMGLDTPMNVSGNYYLQTAAKPPFALGTRGA